MANLASNRWIQLGAASIIAVAIGAVIGASLSTSEGSASAEDADVPVVTERVLFTTGSSPDPQNVIELPITGEGAVAAGWKDPVLCSPGRGRYFTKGTATEGEQYVLMFNRQSELIGVYNFAFTEKPRPWKKIEELLGPGGVDVVPTEHWGIFTYFVDPTRACKTTEAGEGTRPAFIP